MKKILIILLAVIVLVIAYYFVNRQLTQKLIGPTFKNLQEPVPKPLSKYTIEALSKTNFQPSLIQLGDLIKDEQTFSSRFFYFYDNGKKVSGIANLPKAPGVYPTIIMFRGYIDKEKYTTGTGTARSGEFFAQNGFITLAPDFLGYGESDNPSDNPMEERFQTYTTVLTLLKSIKNLNQALINQNLDIKVDPQKVFLWGHSNGGQIALTILEITQNPYPTVLWAPVSKPFPYSILYYTDDFDDRGKMLRKVIADFEKDYDVELYSLTNYFEKINAPIQLHQGEADDAVPPKWSDQLHQKLKDLGKEVIYFTYPDEDHNFSQGAWTTVVNRNLDFYQRHLKD